MFVTVHVSHYFRLSVVKVALGRFVLSSHFHNQMGYLTETKHDLRTLRSDTEQQLRLYAEDSEVIRLVELAA